MKRIIRILLVLFPLAVIGQTQTENYTKKTTYKIPTTVKIASPTISEAIQNITYFDGLGRPKQQIDNAQSPLGKDIVTPIEYDGFGRKEKDYLPYVPAASASLNYKTNALTELGTFYNVSSYENTTNPYSQKEFEASPLNRISKQAAPGQDWKLGNGHEVRFQYESNTNLDQVRRFEVSFISGNAENPYLEDKGVYASNQLYKTITKDENWKENQPYPTDHTTQEFKNKEGRVILKRNFDAYMWHDTYYVYDVYGNLTYVLPPKVNTYSSLGQLFQNQQIYLDNYTNGASLLEDNLYFHEISMNIANGILECYFYGENFQAENLRGGKIADLDFTPDLPNMNLGSIFMYDSSGHSKYAGYAYIENGDLYFDAEYGQFSSSQEGSYVSQFSINLDNWQTNFKIPSLDRSTLDDLIYQYKYDDRNRLVEKKLPGKGWEYIIYDKLDRPVLTQDANLRTSGKWLFTKYDVFSRPVYTGEYVNTQKTTRAEIQQLVNTITNISEIKTASNVLNGTTISYSNVTFPNTSDINVLTINYYDNYNFDLDGGIAESSYNIMPITDVKGMNTGSKIRILGTNSWITNVFYYDNKSRLIYNFTKNNYLTTTSKIKNEFDFIGNLQSETTTHLKDGITISILDSFTYDHAGRLTKQTQKINDAAVAETILVNSYDELGKLSSKKVGGKTAVGLQNLDYTYNIRGWLKTFNDPKNATSGNTDLFGYELYYNNVLDPIYNNRPLYNGNISNILWKRTDSNKKQYNFTYDALSRLKAAYYSESAVIRNRFDEIIERYDRNGNILSLNRSFPTPNIGNGYSSIDVLTYTYNQGNRLEKIDDYIKNSTYGNEGFKDGTNTDDDYSYDNNGNMMLDKNKGITAITYNHLNLPLKVTFANGTIDYVYDAAGVKQRKIVNPGLITDYAGGFQYENNTLKFFTQSEGFVEYNSGNFRYIYQYKDHLGNIRLSYSDTNGDGIIAATEILEENDYYPFGLKHKNNSVVNSTSSVLKYKYNGKELQDELGLNFYDYGARNYDPVIARWMNIDPLAEISRRWSPYNYAYNNPVYFIDPDGMMADDWKTDSNGNMVFDPTLTAENASTQLGTGEKYVGKSAFQDNGNGTSTIYNEGGSKDIAVNLSNVTINPEKSYVSSGAYGPYMGPDAMSVSYSVSVNGFFFSANVSVGLAFTGNDAAALLSGGVNWGPQSDLELPGVKGGWSIAAHNNEGTSNDVLAGLGGDSVGYFGGAVIGGAISQSATKNGQIDPNGVSNISVNLGPTIGFGKMKSSGYSFKASDGINYLKSQF